MLGTSAPCKRCLPLRMGASRSSATSSSSFPSARLAGGLVSVIVSSAAVAAVVRALWAAGSQDEGCSIGGSGGGTCSGTFPREAVLVSVVAFDLSQPMPSGAVASFRCSGGRRFDVQHARRMVARRPTAAAHRNDRSGVRPCSAINRAACQPHELFDRHAGHPAHSFSSAPRRVQDSHRHSQRTLRRARQDLRCSPRAAPHDSVLSRETSL